MKEINYWQFIRESLNDGNPAVLMVVAESSKSSPGRAGFKMVVTANGRIAGTIGGGIMEHNLIDEAKGLLLNNQKKSFVKILFHNKESQADKSGLICGGTQTVILKTIYPDEIESIHLLNNFFSEMINGVLTISKSDILFCPGRWNEKQFVFESESDSDWKYEENTGFPNTVYVIGGGHVGLAVSRIMSTLDFYVITIDPRKDIFTMMNNSYADKKVNNPYDEAGKLIKETDRSFVVIVTSEHDSDAAALKSVITKNVKYIGMMGSKRKIKSIFEQLTKSGINPDLFSKVRTPIGLEIEAESPEEIAISIAAEIIKVKNG